MILPIKRILWPTDFSEASYEALSRAVELCLHFSAELVAVHVVPEIPRITPASEVGIEKPGYIASIKKYERELHNASRQKLHEVIRERVPKDVKSAVVITRGEPASEILRTAEDERVSLIVTATHGLSGWRQLVFGSVAERVVRLAACPVLTIRSPRVKR